jgi:hypothetical protein
VSGEGKCDRWIAGFDMCKVDEACESEVRVCTRMILDFRLVKTEGATSAEQLSHYMLDRSQVEVFVHVYRTQSCMYNFGNLQQPHCRVKRHIKAELRLGPTSFGWCKVKIHANEPLQ